MKLVSNLGWTRRESNPLLVYAIDTCYRYTTSPRCNTYLTSNYNTSILIFMVSFVHTLILSAVEGLTEFLPISSTGHLILVSKLLGLADTDFLKTFEIVIQLGAIMAIVVLYFKKFISSWNLIKKLITAFIPTGAVGLVLYPFIKNVLLGSSAVTLNALFWGGVAIIAIEWYLRRKKAPVKKESEVTYQQALIIGTFQSLSVIPGVSRSAATIIGGLLTGLDRETATEFSFLLAVPTMVAASALDIYKSRAMILHGGGMFTIVLGTVLSFLFAIAAVKFLIGYIKKHDFTAFGIYRIILSVLFWIFVK